MKIGKVSKQMSVSIDTLRYYEKIGLLKPKRKDGYRNYSAKDLERLAFIITLKKATFSLEDIRFLFIFEDTYLTESDILTMNSKDLNDLLALIHRKKQEVVRRVEELTQAKEMLDKFEKKLKTLEE